MCIAKVNIESPQIPPKIELKLISNPSEIHPESNWNLCKAFKIVSKQTQRSESMEISSGIFCIQIHATSSLKWGKEGREKEIFFFCGLIMGSFPIIVCRHFLNLIFIRYKNCPLFKSEIFFALSLKKENSTNHMTTQLLEI